MALSDSPARANASIVSSISFAPDNQTNLPTLTVTSELVVAPPRHTTRTVTRSGRKRRRTTLSIRLRSNIFFCVVRNKLAFQNRGVSLQRMVERLRRYLIGWRGYLGICQTPSVLQGLDSWIRRRLRCFQWKQWKRGKIRFAELRKRGVGKDLAAQTAGSSRGPWHISRSPALSYALPGAYFDSLGLPRLHETKLV